jgi:hypothetical protein
VYTCGKPKKVHESGKFPEDFSVGNQVNLEIGDGVPGKNWKTFWI